MSAVSSVLFARYEMALSMLLCPLQKCTSPKSTPTMDDEAPVSLLAAVMVYVVVRDPSIGGSIALHVLFPSQRLRFARIGAATRCEAVTVTVTTSSGEQKPHT